MYVYGNILNIMLSCCKIQIVQIECQLHNANVIVDGVDLIKLVAQESQDQDQDHQDSPQTPEKILTVNSTTGLVYFNDYSDDYSLDSKMIVITRITCVVYILNVPVHACLLMFMSFNVDDPQNHQYFSKQNINTVRLAKRPFY